VSIRFIYNPRAGSDRAGLSELLRAFADERKLDAEILATARPLHARELAAEAVARGCEMVVAVGGDGTINEVARAVIGSGTTLGLVPRGSGNGLARHLGIPLELHSALGNLISGVPLAIDTGIANDHAFLCAMGVGFDAAVVKRFNSLPRRGFTAYLAAAALEFMAHRRSTVSVTDSHGHRSVVRPLLVSVANAAQFGNGAIIAPGARIDDGELDLVIVAPPTPFHALSLARRLFRGTLDRSRHVRVLRGSSFTIERSTDGPMHVDGELVETAATIAVHVRPASLRIVVPRPITS
jgi:YegS/Rv2252/BmrU family lipid kinase